MLKHKIRIVSRSLKVNARIVDSGQPVAILAALGGFEIALLAGIMLGCASRRIPVLVDGFICTSAYAAALAIWPGVADYAFISHISAEPAYGAILQKLPDEPYALLHMDMRLGEGTGCALALSIVRGAAAIFNEMATFASACVNATEADRITI